MNETQKELSASCAEVADGVVVLELAGDLDAASGPYVAQMVEELDRAVLVIVDMSRVGFCDAAGIGGLLQAEQRMKTRGGTLTIVGLSGFLDRLFRLLRLDRRIVWSVTTEPDVPGASPGGSGGLRCLTGTGTAKGTTSLWSAPSSYWWDLRAASY